MSVHRDAFDTLATRLEEELGDALQELVLYGSVAHGAEREESDVDVFAVVADDDDKEAVYDAAAAVGREYGVHIAAVVRTAAEYRKTADTVFTREVMESGVAAV